MKVLLIYFIVVASLSNTKVTIAQSLESILETHFKVTGQEKLLSVQSILTEGILRQGGLNIEIKSFIKRPNKYRLEGRYEGFNFVEVFDGKIGWTFNQMLGDTTPSLLAGEELEILKSQADIDGLLYNYRSKGFEIEMLEPESIGNILTDVLLLSKPDGLQIKYYIDTETGVILKETTVVKIAGIKRTYESFYRDYRYVNQILFPFSVSVNLEGELIMEIDYTAIELNAEIKDYRFATPQNLKREVDSNNTGSE